MFTRLFLDVNTWESPVPGKETVVRPREFTVKPFTPAESDTPFLDTFIQRPGNSLMRFRNLKKLMNLYSSPETKDHRESWPVGSLFVSGHDKTDRDSKTVVPLIICWRSLSRELSSFTLAPYDPTRVQNQFYSRHLTK